MKLTCFHSCVGKPSLALARSWQKVGSESGEYKRGSTIDLLKRKRRPVLSALIGKYKLLAQQTSGWQPRFLGESWQKETLCVCLTVLERKGKREGVRAGRLFRGEEDLPVAPRRWPSR